VPLGAHLYASLISACASGKDGTPSKRLQRAQNLHAKMLGALLQHHMLHILRAYMHSCWSSHGS
jgi:hypothetical protein